jgi:hypothetical protein
MARLPTPGADNGQWGDILNDFLSVEHNTDGTLKTAAVPLAQKGAANGVATLDSSGKLTNSQLPTTVATKSTNVADTGKAIDAYTGNPLTLAASKSAIIGFSEQVSSYVWSGNSIQTVVGIAFVATTTAVDIELTLPDITMTTAPAANSTVTVDLYDAINLKVLRKQIVPVGSITTASLPMLRRLLTGLTIGSSQMIYFRIKLSFGSNSTTLNAGPTPPDENPVQLTVREAVIV